MSEAGAIYKFWSFSRLCNRADKLDDFDEPLEETMTKALARFASIDSRRWIFLLLEVLTNGKTQFTKAEMRMLQMFQFTVWQRSYEDCGFSSVYQGITELKKNPVMCQELIELLQYNYNLRHRSAIHSSPRKRYLTQKERFAADSRESENRNLCLRRRQMAARCSNGCERG